MLEGRSKSNWSHTSAILCIIAEVNRDSKKKPSPFKPSDFDPHAKAASKDVVIPKVKMKDLKSLVPQLAKLASQRRD
jgi:hypothetical protein